MFATHVLYNGNKNLKFLKSLSMIEKQIKHSKKGRLLHMGYLQITLPILTSMELKSMNLLHIYSDNFIIAMSNNSSSICLEFVSL